MDVFTPDFAAKVGTLVCLLHGLVHFVAPRYTSKKYGVTVVSGVVKVATRRLGACLISIAALSLSLNVLHRSTINHAVAMATIPWLVDGIISLFQNEPKNYLFSLLTNLFMTFLNFFTFVVTFKENHELAPLAIKAYTGWYVINAITFILIPVFGGSGLWNVMKLDKDMQWILHCSGFPALALATYLVLIDNFDMMLQARVLGYSFVALTAGLIAPLMSKQKHGQMEIRHQVMLAGSAVLTGLLLRDDAVLEQQ
jgi:hypothetical protein